MSAAAIEALVVLAVQYGVPFVQNIIATMKKQNVTLDELDALFNSVKPYEAYGIPDKVPSQIPVATN